MEAGLGVARAIKAHSGTQYKTGQACDLVYRMAGDSVDFAYGEEGIRWAYSAELRDTGTVSGSVQAARALWLTTLWFTVWLPITTKRDSTNGGGDDRGSVVPSRVHSDHRAGSSGIKSILPRQSYKMSALLFVHP